MTSPTHPFSLDLCGRVLDGRYRVDSVLGRGGMGTVYLGFDRRLSRKIVVKAPHPVHLSEPGFRERFEREIRSLTTLDHPRIVKILDVGEVGPLPYAVLQYLGGGSLQQRLDLAGRQTARDVLAWLIPTADALDFIHSQGTIHRDVKPGNILMDEAGHVYLADFGIAKVLALTDTQLTSTGVNIGSPNYMAPEAIEGHLTPAYDQYSLAVVTFVALSGVLPFEGETPFQVLLNKASKPPTPLSRLLPKLPPEVQETLNYALAADPKARFETCARFAAAIRAAMTTPRASLGATQRVATPKRTASNPRPPERGRTSQRPNTTALLVVLGLVAAVGLVGLWWKGRTPGSPPDPTSPSGSLPSVSQRDSVGPELSDFEPRSGEATFASSILLTGRIGERCASVTASPGDVPGKLSDDGRSFTMTLPIALGENRFEIRARDLSDNETRIGWTLHRRARIPWNGATFRSENRAGYDEYTLDKDPSVILIHIPASEFVMGSASQHAREDEKPLTRVRLSAHLLAKHEVTWEQYERFCRATRRSLPATPPFGRAPNHPVVHVSWREAAAYCAWAEVRLPTEAEWEHAARGSERRSWPWGWTPHSSASPRGNFGAVTKGSDASDGYEHVAPVGSFPGGTGAFGLLDQAGNVWEWCADAYAPYRGGSCDDPSGPTSSSPTERVIRGGSWYSGSEDARGTRRHHIDQTSSEVDLGFRVARTLR